MFSLRSKPSRVRFPTFYRHFSLQFTLPCALTGDSWGNRTPVAGVRGRSLNRLTNEPLLEVKGFYAPLPRFWCTIRDSNPGHPD